MNPQDAWPGRLTSAIGAEIKRRRADRKMSAQQLSDACAELGLDMPRSTIADLENGRRAHVAISEWLVIAKALGVPPLLLVFPVGTEAEVEALPGETRPAFAAAQWVAGEGPFPGPDDAAYLASIAADWLHATGNPLELYRAHARAVAEEAHAMRRAADMEARAQDPATAAERNAFTTAAGALRQTAALHQLAADNLRRRAKELGLLPPGQH